MHTIGSEVPSMSAGRLLPERAELARDPEWLELIAELRLRKDRLVGDFFDRFDGSVVYGGAVPRDDLVQLVHDSMDMYLIMLSGEPLPADLAGLPAGLGTRRARQGVPAEQLLEGVRMNSRVLWNALREIAEPERVGCLVRNTDTFLGLVEWHVREVQYAYLREAEFQQRRTETTRRQALRRLLEDDEVEDAELAALCVGLGIPVDARFELAVRTGPHPQECDLCEASPDAWVFDQGRTATHFRVCEPGEPRFAGATGRLAHLVPIDGAASLRAAQQTGTMLLLITPALPGVTEVLTPRSSWASLAWHSIRESLPEPFAPVSLEPLRGLTASARRRLVETARIFIETGSIKSSSERLFCHRNTVVKRLAQLEQLLGLRFSIPREAALIVLALEDPSVRA